MFSGSLRQVTGKVAHFLDKDLTDSIIYWTSNTKNDLIFLLVTIGPLQQDIKINYELKLIVMNIING